WGRDHLRPRAVGQPPRSLTTRWLSVSVMKSTPLGLTAIADGAASTVAVPSPATVVIVPFGEPFRTRLLPLSAMYTLPALSTARPVGKLRSATVAGPPSPPYAARPLPAKVTMLPPWSISLTRLLFVSAMKRLP